MIPAPLVYEVPYTNTTYGTYWQGNRWAVAPAGSWVMWGSNPFVLASTDQGTSWVTIAGINNAGFPNSSTVDYTGPSGTTLLYNAECGHRNTFNRFYLMGNGNPIGTYTVAPLYNWASDDGQQSTMPHRSSTQCMHSVAHQILLCLSLLPHLSIFSQPVCVCCLFCSVLLQG